MLTITETEKQLPISARIYVGAVIENNDPAGLQRVKVRLPQYPIDMPNDCIPWASPEKAGGFGSGNSAGNLIVPRIGTLVMVRHYPDQYSPLYSMIQTTVPDQLVDNNYPNVYGLQDPNGDYIKFDLIRKILTLIMTGEIRLSSNDEGSDVKIQIGGNVNLVCKGLNIQSSDVNLTTQSIITNGTLSVRDVQTGNVTTNNLSTKAAQIGGAVIEGSLEGTAKFATFAGYPPGYDLPLPITVDPELPDPIRPDVVFD